MNSHLSSGHLTQEEIYQWLSGERAIEVEEHFRDCTACQDEMHQLRNALVGFRGSLEQVPVPAISRRSLRRSSLRPGRQALPRWILATAALSLVVAGPVYWNVHQQRAVRANEEQMKTDQLLLERVDAGLSREVPASMEPLMQLISKEEKE